METLRNIDIENIIFIDIETVSGKKDFYELAPEWQDLWQKKAKSISRGEETAADVYDKASIYAEFGKVICIGVGILRKTPGHYQLRVKSIHGHNEADILQRFADLLNKSFDSSSHLLCAHNGKEFDFPYLSRRMMVHGIKLPRLLDLAGKKPWEVPHIDTMELWKFGDFKSFTSLNLLAHLFGIPTPKDDIDGSKVGAVYYQENDLERIARYCIKDVVTLVQLFLRFRGDHTLNEADISIAQEN